MKREIFGLLLALSTFTISATVSKFIPLRREAVNSAQTKREICLNQIPACPLPTHLGEIIPVEFCECATRRAMTAAQFASRQ